MNGEGRLGFPKGEERGGENGGKKRKKTTGRSSCVGRDLTRRSVRAFSGRMTTGDQDQERNGKSAANTGRIPNQAEGREGFLGAKPKEAEKERKKY